MFRLEAGTASGQPAGRRRYAFGRPQFAYNLLQKTFEDRAPPDEPPVRSLDLIHDGGADFVAAVRALDRVLLSGFYVIPLYYLPVQWIARWRQIKRPQRTSLFGYLPETWWYEQAKS